MTDKASFIPWIPDIDLLRIICNDCYNSLRLIHIEGQIELLLKTISGLSA